MPSEDPLNLSPTLLNAALDHIDDVLLITGWGPLDESGPTIVYVNDAFTKMTGYSAEEVIGKTPRILQGPETSAEGRAKIREALEKWEPVRVELTNYRKDGSTFEVEISIQPIWKDDLVTHWVAVQRDITADRERMRKQAHEDRLRSLGFLSGGIAHDFNNVLHAIGVMLELAESEASEDHRFQLYEDMRFALKRGSELATRLLSFSRPETGLVERVDLGEAIERTLDLCLKGVVTRGKLHIDGPLEIVANPTQLHQTFMNITLNARHAMGDEGQLDVRVTQDKEGWVDVSFEDAGPGFDDEQLKHAFEPFYTTREGGTGLGLSIVHGILMRHEGEVTLGRSEAGGAKVTTSWRITEPAEVVVETPTSLRVLVVEDESLNRRLVSRLIETLGHTATGIATAEEALEQVRVDMFDLALVDINLGEGMKGSELGRWLKKRRLIERIVFMSANHNVASSLTDISDDFLGKPFSKAELMEMLKSE